MCQGHEGQRQQSVGRKVEGLADKGIAIDGWAPPDCMYSDRPRRSCLNGSSAWRFLLGC